MTKSAHWWSWSCDLHGLSRRSFFCSQEHTPEGHTENDQCFNIMWFIMKNSETETETLMLYWITPHLPFLHSHTLIAIDLCCIELSCVPIFLQKMFTVRLQHISFGVLLHQRVPQYLINLISIRFCRLFIM